MAVQTFDPGGLFGSVNPTRDPIEPREGVERLQCIVSDYRIVSCK